MTMQEILQTTEYKKLDLKLVVSGLLLAILTVAVIVSFVLFRVLFYLDLVAWLISLVCMIRNIYKETKYIHDNIDNDSKLG